MFNSKMKAKNIPEYHQSSWFVRVLLESSSLNSLFLILRGSGYGSLCTYFTHCTFQKGRHCGPLFFFFPAQYRPASAQTSFGKPPLLYSQSKQDMAIHGQSQCSILLAMTQFSAMDRHGAQTRPMRVCPELLLELFEKWPSLHGVVGCQAGADGSHLASSMWKPA